jgi:hypothetical protein
LSLLKHAAAENFDVLERLCESDAQHSPIRIIGFEAS